MTAALRFYVDGQPLGWAERGVAVPDVGSTKVRGEQRYEVVRVRTIDWSGEDAQNEPLKVTVIDLRPLE